MIQPEDNKTLDLLEPVKRPRGRPSTGAAMSAAVKDCTTPAHKHKLAKTRPGSLGGCRISLEGGNREQELHSWSQT